MRHQRVQDEACHTDAVKLILRGLFDVGADDVQELRLEKSIAFFREVTAGEQGFRPQAPHRGEEVFRDLHAQKDTGIRDAVILVKFPGLYQDHVPGMKKMLPRAGAHDQIVLQGTQKFPLGVKVRRPVFHGVEENM